MYSFGRGMSKPIGRRFVALGELSNANKRNSMYSPSQVLDVRTLAASLFTPKVFLLSGYTNVEGYVPRFVCS